MATQITSTTSVHDSNLKKSLGPLELTATGVGIILGAGIYVIIGKTAGLAGGAIWIPFVLGAFAAALTGLSYAELSSMFPKAGASFEYTKAAFGIKLGFIVGWLFVLSNIISASAVSLGFGGYLASFMGIGIVPIAVVLIVICSALLIVGVKETVWVGVLFTVIEVAGLVLVIVTSARFVGSADYFEMPHGMVGVFQATTLIFFAYLGFEQIANLSEEAKNPSKTIPTAIIMAIIISSVLYALVAITSISALSWQELSQSNSPLAEVVRRTTGAGASQVIVVIALFATANTVLFMLLTATRMMFGMSNSATLPKAIGRVHPRRKTPWVATLVAGGIAIAFTLLGSIQLVAQITNFAILTAFVLVNASLIWLRRTQPDIPRPFRVPLNVGNVPVLPLLGIAVSLFMLANVGVQALIVGVVIAVVGFAIPYVVPRFGDSQLSATNE